MNTHLNLKWLYWFRVTAHPERWGGKPGNKKHVGENSVHRVVGLTPSLQRWGRGSSWSYPKDYVDLRIMIHVKHLCRAKHVVNSIFPNPIISIKIPWGLFSPLIGDFQIPEGMCWGWLKLFLKKEQYTNDWIYICFSNIVAMGREEALFSCYISRRNWQCPNLCV